MTWKTRPVPLGGAGLVVIVEPLAATAVIVTWIPPIRIALLTNSVSPSAVPAYVHTSPLTQVAVAPVTLQVPRAPGMSGCVIETTWPTSLLRPRSVVCQDALRAFRHSIGVTPPHSSRVRVAAIRRA